MTSRVDYIDSRVHLPISKGRAIWLEDSVHVWVLVRYFKHFHVLFFDRLQLRLQLFGFLLVVRCFVFLALDVVLYVTLFDFQAVNLFVLTIQFVLQVFDHNCVFSAVFLNLIKFFLELLIVLIDHASLVFAIEDLRSLVVSILTKELLSEDVESSFRVVLPLLLLLVVL